MARRKKPTFQQIYFNLLSEVYDSVSADLAELGFEPVDFGFIESVPYGKTVSNNYAIKKADTGKYRHLHMSIYRMDGGKYELVAYIN